MSHILQGNTRLVLCLDASFWKLTSHCLWMRFQIASRMKSLFCFMFRGEVAAVLSVDTAGQGLHTLQDGKFPFLSYKGTLKPRNGIYLGRVHQFCLVAEHSNKGDCNTWSARTPRKHTCVLNWFRYPTTHAWNLTGIEWQHSWYLSVLLVRWEVLVWNSLLDTNEE